KTLRKRSVLPVRMWRTAAALGAGTAVLISACGAPSEGAAPGEDSEATDDGADAETIEVEDNFGTHTVTLPLESVVATDNRTFRTLDDWGVELSAAAVSLMPPGLSYVEDSSIVDLGSHREPD